MSLLAPLLLFFVVSVGGMAFQGRVDRDKYVEQHQKPDHILLWSVLLTFRTMFDRLIRDNIFW